MKIFRKNKTLSHKGFVTTTHNIIKEVKNKGTITLLVNRLSPKSQLRK